MVPGQARALSDGTVGRPAERLTVIDDLLLRNHRRPALEPVIIQGIWVGVSPLSADEVDGIHRRLARTRLGFLARMPRIPGARRQWLAADACHPIDRTSAIDARDVLRWSDARSREDLDPTRGPGWRLSTATLTDGGCVLAVTCSHALIDGRGLIRLLAEYLPTESTAVPTTAVDPSTDLGDARRQWSIVGSGSVRAWVGLATSAEQRRELRRYRTSQSARHRPISAANLTAATAGATIPAPEATRMIVEIDSAEWDRRAEKDGATANSAFVRACGRIAAALAGRDRATVGVAVDSRADRLPATAPDTSAASAGSANAVAMAAVPVSVDDGPEEVRERCRAAYSAAVAAPAGFPAELIQVLPDSIVDRMAPAPGRYDALCSNLGAAPCPLQAIGAVPARMIAGGAVGPTGEYASLFILRVGGRYSLTLTLRPGTAQPIPPDLVESELGPILQRW